MTAIPSPPLFAEARPRVRTHRYEAEAYNWDREPLHHLCWIGSESTLRWVDLDVAHNLPLRAHNNDTLLHICCRYNFPALAQGLLERGLDVNATTQGGNTALHLACSPARRDGAILDILLKAGAQVNAVNFLHETPLHFAAKRDSESVPLLLEHGADPSIVAEDGSSCLHYAAKHNSAAAFAHLIKHPGVAPLVNLSNKHGNTPLHAACSMGSTEIARALIAAGAAPQALNLRHQTPRQLGTNRFGIVKLFEDWLWRNAVRVFLLVCQQRYLVTDSMLLEQLFGPEGYVFRYVDRGDYVDL
eukprot:TRINITY_DN12789_c0_g1_i1.p2 TRINITY_DN12789_c0_g1~~TRINITY_DN12789_c0_g1_i1.p2  ORF type:complete len:311 (+),score=42.38 TRINITY_DN12789_c0_g1_i1:32-934(+)